MTFKASTIGNIASVQTGPFGSQLHNKDYVLVGTPIVTVEHLGERKMTRQNLPCVSNADRERLSKYILQYGDLVFSRVGSVDRCSWVSEDEDGWMFSGRCLRVRPNNPDEIYHKYLYYFFCLESTKDYVRNRAVGATMPSINTRLLSEVPINYPSIEAQRSIGDTLSVLDDRIEANKKMNHHLEQMAQAIFKSWFVDFEPWGGVMPNDWQKIQLAEIVETVNGYTYKSSELVDSTTAMATIKNFERGGGFKLEGFKEILPSSKIKPSQFVNLYETIVAHTDLTQKAEVIGNAEILLSTAGYKRIVASMDLVKVLPAAEGLTKFVLGAILKSPLFKEHCLGYTNGTTVLHLSKRAIPEYSLYFPQNIEILGTVNSLLEPLYLQMSLNIDESARLISLRDTLLPRLMSGELSVADLPVK